MPAESFELAEHKVKRRKMTRSHIFKVLFILLSLVLLIVTALLITMLVFWATGRFKTTSAPATHPPPTTTAHVNHNPGFEQVADILAKSINQSINPCNDFYQYACGTWRQNNQMPPEQKEISPFTMIRSRISNQLSSSLGSETEMKKFPAAVQTAGKIYRNCINSTSSQLVGKNNSLLALIGSDLGGWPPITVNWKSTSTVWNVAGVLSGRHFVNTLLTPSVSFDWKNPKSSALYLDQATLALGSPFYYTNTHFARVIAAYKALMLSVAQTLARDAGTIGQVGDDLGKYVDHMLNFEVSLAKALDTSSRRRSYQAQYNTHTYESLQKTWASINWKDYIMALLGKSYNTFISTAPTLVVNEPNYLHSLTVLVELNPPKTTISYILWRLIYDNLQFVNQPSIQASLLELASAKGGVSSLPPSTQACTTFLLKYVPFAIGRLYVDNATTEKTQQQIELLGNNIVAAFKSMLTGIPWMDVATKLQADKKVDAVGQNIGFPQWIRNDTRLNDRYRTLIIDIEKYKNQDWFTVMSKTQQDYSVWYWSQLFSKTNPIQFHGSPANVNGFYSNLNLITIPAGTLQPPFFQANFPQAWNYGAIGMLLGHMVTHGFNDEGLQFDQNRMLNPWLTKTSQANFANTTQCVINEYSKFCYIFNYGIGLCINGYNTQGENIADNGGIKAAYQAYQQYVFSHGSEGRLPGYPTMTTNQLFFLGFAHMWCRNVYSDALQKQLLLDQHSPARYRVIGTLRNFPEFGKAFGCKLGDNMYPNAPCNVW